jgi:hypothetical protein
LQDKWIDEFVDAEATTSPTYDLEECMDIVSFSLSKSIMKLCGTIGSDVTLVIPGANGKFVYNLLKRIVTYLGVADTPRKHMTILGVIVGFASGCKEYIGKNLTQFMEE